MEMIKGFDKTLLSVFFLLFSEKIQIERPDKLGLSVGIKREILRFQKFLIADLRFFCIG